MTSGPGSRGVRTVPSLSEMQGTILRARPWGREASSGVQETVCSAARHRGDPAAGRRGQAWGPGCERGTRLVLVLSASSGVLHDFTGLLPHSGPSMNPGKWPQGARGGLWA